MTAESVESIITNFNQTLSDLRSSIETLVRDLEGSLQQIQGIKVGDVARELMKPLMESFDQNKIVLDDILGTLEKIRIKTEEDKGGFFRGIMGRGR